MNPLVCPVCAKALTVEQARAFCENSHSFDRAREGHFNLLLSQSSHSHGDDRAMLRARRVFLEKGFYKPLLSALQEEVFARFPQKGVLVDAGCGEGYYTRGILSYLRQGGKTVTGLGFDISKDAVKMTAKTCEKEDLFFVASTYRIPVASESVDLILSLFAPYSEEEFLRILKPGGFLIRAVPLEDHLYELKCAVYDCPTRNTAKAQIGKGFSNKAEREVRYRMNLNSSEEISALFGMTPYAHKTSPEDAAKLNALEQLETRAEFALQILEKNSEKIS